MSCDVAAAAFLFLAAAGPAPSAPVVQPPEISVAREPLYADIVARAARLKAEVERFETQGKGPAVFALPKFDVFEGQIGELSALDMKGHLDLAARGVDGDLKCILRGISQDLPKRLAEVKAAPDWAAQVSALKEMSYLLNDNVEVITAPPRPPV
jgi:hypothetical protein